jgi:endonuclease G
MPVLSIVLKRSQVLIFFHALPDEKKTGWKAGFDINKWVGERELGDVLPLRADSLPRNTFNTVQAKNYMGKNENIKVCGTVVSTKLSSKGNIFLNLDKKFPNQILVFLFLSDYTTNFSYQPEKYLAGKTICVTGKVTNYNGNASL